MHRILIFANGQLPDLDAARALLHADDFIIAADGGTHNALTLGLTPNLIVGDLDSLTLDLRPLTDQGTKVIQFPRDKNETDLELALQHAAEMQPEQVIIVGALGGRLDQTLGNIALLSDARLLNLDLRLDDGVEELYFCRSQAEVHGRSGELVSLIPWGVPVEGVRTDGLRWPLSDETLYPDKTRGISNELLGERATVRIRSGLLLVVHRRTSQER
ncbi:MAG: thiamine diphosphokinase [Chloroflexi bacterium]|nr:thiamine diphosphokinase [Chloroflexota bacterium]